MSAVTTPQVTIVRGRRRLDTRTSRKGGQCVVINTKCAHFVEIFNPNRGDYVAQVRLDDRLIEDEPIRAGQTARIQLPNVNELVTVRVTFRSPMNNMLPGNPCVKLTLGREAVLRNSGHMKPTKKFRNKVARQTAIRRRWFTEVQPSYIY